MVYPQFIGLDISITGTGIVVIDSTMDVLVSDCLHSKPQKDWYGRIKDILLRIESRIMPDSATPKCLFVEDYAFAAKGKVFNIAELSGVIKYHLSKVWKPVPFLRIPPTSLKKFTTGTGNAAKELMLKEVYKKYGVDFNDDNVADAYALARMGMAITMADKLPVYQMDAIRNVWKNNDTTLEEWKAKTIRTWGNL